MITTQDDLRNSMVALLHSSAGLHRSYDEGQARVLGRALADCLPIVALDPPHSTPSQRSARQDFCRLCISLEVALRRAGAYLDSDHYRAEVVEHVREFRKLHHLTQRTFGWTQD